MTISQNLRDLLLRIWERGLCLLMFAVFMAASAAQGDDLSFYEDQVLPVLREHCLKCHSHAAGKARGGLVLDSRAALLSGGDSGAAVVPGDAAASLLVDAVRYQSDVLQMPPDGKLADAQIEVLVEWVRRGADAPESNEVAGTATATANRGDHWAFQPLQRVEVPGALKQPRQVIDYLAEAARQRAGVAAVGRTDQATFVRRLYLDLIGLPPPIPGEPAAAETASLAEDQGTADDLVDRLLAMPEFGERWGRHWLDVARYADSNGCSIESNNTYDNAWRYRDYVIASWNNDKPYDRFVVEQIAGDLLDYVSTTERCEQLVATGFLLLGPKAFGTSSFEQLRLDVVDEQIDTVGKAMLGLSLGCARCHDHKFDPISTNEYYAMAGIFGSTESVRRARGWRQSKTWHRVPLPVLDGQAEKTLLDAYENTKRDAENGVLQKRAEEQLRGAESELTKLKEAESSDPEAMAAAAAALAAARRELKNAENMAKVLPVISPIPVAMAVTDKESPANEAVRIRGEPDNRGQLVERGILSLFAAAPPVPPGRSGRLQLAEWMVDTENGAGQLLARVAVNRIWGHLFAKPLVDSADNFGVTGAAPSHPELLDYLAERLIESDWSAKAVIREIVLSRTYSLAAEIDAGNQATDPDNVWLWRYEPKRIDVEVLRDSLLAITGQLDRSRGGKTLQHLGLVSLGGDHLLLDAPSPYFRRSVYLPIYRDAIGLTDDIDASMGMLATFDFADPNLMAGLRAKTVVPAQALFLMNGEFVLEQAEQLASQLLEEGRFSSDAERIDHLTTVAYGRSAGESERREVLRFLSAFSPAADSVAKPTGEAALRAWTALCQAVFGSNEFLFQD